MIQVAYSPEYVFAVSNNHKFPMQKYARLQKALVERLNYQTYNFFVPDPINSEHILRVHNESYVSRFESLSISPKEQRQTGFIHTSELVRREKIIAQGTLQATDFAMEHGIAFNIAGGTHHAFTSHGEGFCMYNDQAIAAAYFLSNHPDKKVLILDLDVHQGNGTAEIFSNENRVFTCSMHGKDNYPLHKEKSSLDLELPTGCKDELYLTSLSKILKNLRSEEFGCIFYQAGVDILADDKLGLLNISLEGVRLRESMVLNFAKALKLPIIVCMGGGYHPDVDKIVEAHMLVFEQATVLY